MCHFGFTCIIKPMRELDVEKLSQHIESHNYNPLQLLPSFSTVKPDTVYNADNRYNNESITIDNVSLENEDFRVTLHADGSWDLDLWRGHHAV